MAGDDPYIARSSAAMVLAVLTHWGLVTPYGAGDLVQYWYLTNVDVLSERPCCIHFKITLKSASGQWVKYARPYLPQGGILATGVNTVSRNNRYCTDIFCFLRKIQHWQWLMAGEIQPALGIHHQTTLHLKTSCCLMSHFRENEIRLIRQAMKEFYSSQMANRSLTFNGANSNGAQ